MAAELAHHDAPRREGIWVQRLLRGGLALSVVLMAVGLAVQLASGSRYAAPVRMFDVADANVTTGARLMALGILVLAFTPVLRVLALVLLWAKERDWRFVGVAVVVAVTLGLAIALGGG